MINGMITVRSQSTRLPEKCFLPFGEGNVIEHIIRRAKHFEINPVVCTTIKASDDRIVDIAQQEDENIRYINFKVIDVGKGIDPNKIEERRGTSGVRILP